MQYLSLFFLSGAIAFSGALMPGPLLTAVIAESSRQGFRSGPLMVLGHALAELAMVILILAGIARFVSDPFVLSAVSLAAGGILVFFGADMLLSLPRLSIDIPAARRRNNHIVLLGITVSLSNPYWLIWWLTIGVGLVLTAQKAGLPGLIVFFSGHILADLAWYCLVSGMVSKGRKFMDNRAYKTIIAVCAAALIAFGVWFAASGIAQKTG